MIGLNGACDEVFHRSGRRHTCTLEVGHNGNHRCAHIEWYLVEVAPNESR